MKIIFEGREDKIKTLEKLNRTFSKRNGVKISVVEEDNETENILNVKDTVELINMAESIEDLEQFDSDNRKGVIKAREAKKIELS